MKKIVGILLLCSLSLGLNAQIKYSSGGKSSKPKSKGFDKQKLVYGGWGTLQFWGGATKLGASPIIGYKITPNLTAGLSLGYLYESYKDATQFFNLASGRQESYPERYHSVTPSIWARYSILNSFYFQTQFEQAYMSMSRTLPAANVDGKMKDKLGFFMPTLLVGAGYYSHIANRTALYLGVYYDVLQNSTQKTVTSTAGYIYNVKSPYSGMLYPVIGIGFGF
ncbi:MAG TPA: hypothetical protein PKX92_03345 [Edaphocola sp.]|nr:hypothetical protein [Edaphocola sp.]